MRRIDFFYFGIFGSPSFVVDGEMFWGDDRLEEAMAWATGTHRLQSARQETFFMIRAAHSQLNP